MIDWLLRRFCDPNKLRRGNCYFAIFLYMKYGGHLIVSKSAGHPVIPHVAWTDELPPTMVRHFIPLQRKKGWRAILHSPWFKGRWETRIIKAKQPADATYDSGRGR